ncbi:MAG TPA: post-COAP-1 domain-containing protein [Gemmatimonadales bacterium]|nr:post-COAP-1 domain-containing protein [Gemmatimonadales bacterium]
MHVVKGTGLVAVAAALLVIAACEQPNAINLQKAGAVTRTGGTPEGWVGCDAGGKFTGGGRVDPEGVGKVTFGFNIHAEACDSGAIKGQLQVVYHATQTLIHSETMEHFASFPSDKGGSCAEWDGTARMKDVFAGSGWSDHHYFIQVCDNGEPGHGTDTFMFTIDNAGDGTHNNVMTTTLTGGNIQAHKS